MLERTTCPKLTNSVILSTRIFPFYFIFSMCSSALQDLSFKPSHIWRPVLLIMEAFALCKTPKWQKKNIGIARKWYLLLNQKRDAAESVEQ